MAVLQEYGALKEANRRLARLVADLNHVVRGKRSEKLSDDDRQLAFRDLETAVAEVETFREQTAPPPRSRDKNGNAMSASFTVNAITLSRRIRRLKLAHRSCYHQRW